MKNVLITGALGHIGSSLIRNIKFSTTNVYLIDNLYTQRYCSLFDLPNNRKYIFYDMDINSSAIGEIIKKSDVVIHLAAIVDPELSFRNPKLVNRVNKKGLLNVVKLCYKYKIPIIFPSTTSLYGVSHKLIDESCSDDYIKAQSPYAESKIYGENLLKQYGKKGLKYTIFRFGTIFGFSPGMRFQTAVNKFIWQAVTGQKVTIWKTAYHQRRPYLDINDCVNAINHVIIKNLFTKQIYNIVTCNLSVSTIIKEIKEYIPSLKITYINSNAMNNLSYDIVNKKFIKEGFVYRGDISKSISKMILHLKNLD